MSKSEDQIAAVLNQTGLTYIREKTFTDLNHGRSRYDFYLPSMNILIEFDGAQHFKKVPKFHKQYADFMKGQEADRKKNSYALAHSIPLYRIPFFRLKDIKTLADILRPEFRVVSRWHNDRVRMEYLNSLKK